MNQFRTMVLADCTRDRGESHNLRLSLLETALTVTLLGNATQYLDAVGASAGKTQAARAYRAGFAAVGTVERIPYKGKATEETRQQAAAEAARLAGLFSVEFLKVFPLTKTEKTEEEKSEAKTKREAKAKAEAIALAESMGYAKRAPDVLQLGASALVDLIIDQINAGKIIGDNLVTLAKAVKAATRPGKPVKTDKPVESETLTIIVPQAPAESLGARASDVALPGIAPAAMV